MNTPIDPNLRPFVCVCGTSCDRYAKCKRTPQVMRPCGRSNPKLGDTPITEPLAMQACRALVAAYRNGKRNGGTVEWSDVDDAYKLAKAATKAETAATKKV